MAADVALALTAIVSAAGWWNFGAFHFGGGFLHYHEFFHYYLGSKYFRELGYTGLYDCVALAEARSGARRRRGPSLDARPLTNELRMGSPALREPRSLPGAIRDAGTLAGIQTGCAVVSRARDGAEMGGPPQGSRVQRDASLDDYWQPARESRPGVGGGDQAPRPHRSRARSSRPLVSSGGRLAGASSASRSSGGARTIPPDTRSSAAPF